MNNRLHTYFDRTRVGRRDYFRQLIFLTFAPISIILFSLHLFGSYGLTIKPALACSACYVLASAAALIVYLLKGPKKLKYIMSAFILSLIIIQNVRLLVLASLDIHPPHAHYGQHNCLLHPCAYSQHFYLAPHLACRHVYQHNINVPLPLSHRQFDVWSAACYIWFYEYCNHRFWFRG